MTEIEMRKRLAEAIGWTGVRMDCGNLVGTRPDRHGSRCWYAPNPLENDYDAAMLRAWCVGRGWAVETRHTRGPSMASIIWPPGNDEHFCIVADTEEPDPCRRERRALCRAVLQAIEAGGEA